MADSFAVRPITYGILDAFRSVVSWKGAGRCVEQSGVTLTYDDIWNRSGALALYLQTLGVKKGDRVAYMDTNDFRLLDVYLAAARVGAIFVPVNFRLKPAEISYVLSDTEPEVFLVGPRYLSLVAEAAEGMRPIPFVALRGEAPDGWVDYDQTVERYLPESANQTPIDVLNEDPVLIMYTSGTTGFPKGALHTNQSVMANAWRMIYSYGMTDDDVAGVFTAFFHMSGLNMAWATLVAGGSIAIFEEFDATQVTRQLAESGATITLLVPTMVQMSIREPKLAEMPKLRTFLYGGSAMFVEVLVPALEYFGCEMFGVYGQTEMTCTTLLDAKYHLQAVSGGDASRLASVGRPQPGVRVEIRLSDGSIAKRGQIGEVCSRSDMHARGYWRKPDATETLLADGWHASGDLGYFDEAGYLYLVDRAKDMVVRKGENVYPAEVERVLFAHPLVVDVAVIGVPHEEWGEEVVACLVVEAGADIDEITAFGRERMASYKVPTQIRLLSALPKNAGGKTVKGELRISWNMESA